jgi:hypothetical protein
MLSTSVHLTNSKWLSLFSGGLFFVTGQVNRQGSLYSKKNKTKEIKKKKKMYSKGKQGDLPVPLSLILCIGFKES